MQDQPKPSTEAVYTEAADLMIVQKKSSEATRKALIAKGIDKETARTVVAALLTEVEKHQPPPEPIKRKERFGDTDWAAGKSQKLEEQANTGALVSGVIGVVGSVVTIWGYVSASEYWVWAAILTVAGAVIAYMFLDE